MRKAVFETATLADAIGKANRVAPVKGAGADTAAGICIDVDPTATEQVVIRATDLESSFRQVVSVLEVGDEPARWRFPAALANNIMGTLPLETGSQVTIGDLDGVNLQFRCGKTKIKLRLITGDYPKFHEYDPRELPIVQNLARRLKQVTWATRKKGEGILSGVHLDGTHLVATDTYKLAIVPCVVPVSAPVTAPLSAIAGLIKNTSEVRMRAQASLLEVAPDIYTQTTTVLFAGQDYPNYTPLLEFPNEHRIEVNAEQLKAALNRILALSKHEKMPATTIKIGLNTMQLEMEEPDIGKIADEIEVKGGVVDTFTMSFTPENLFDAIDASGRPTVTMGFGGRFGSMSPVRIEDDNEFVAVMAPRKVGS